MKSKGAIKMFQYKQPDLKHLVEKNSICWIMFADMNWRIIALLFSLTSATALAQKEEYLVPGHNLFVNNIAALHRYYPRWNGAGIRLSIKEFRFAGTDIDILGRIVANPNAAANVTSHANIMASLAGGAGNADWAGLGAAPGCHLISSSFVGLMPDPDYDATGISVQNHSYGVDIQSWYGERAAAYDLSSQYFPSLIHVFSAGNKGDSAALDGKYAGIPGFSNLSGEFKMAKNILLVGSVDSFSQPALRSSRGPAYDGRIKPDLMAFGKGGSSESAALVSGVAAVLQQALLETTDSLPYSDLVRALLVNGADDIGPRGPDFASGFGNLNGRKSAQQVYDGFFMEGIVLPSQTLKIPVAVNPTVQSLKITMSWNDPPAIPLTHTALLHDLDMSLVSPTGQVHYPWVLNTYPSADSLSLPATTGIDSLNNLEQIFIGMPASGLWEIQIKAPADMTGPQHFGLAWNLDTLNTFHWAYPLAQTPAISNSGIVAQWDAGLTTGNGVLSWRDVRNDHWHVINDSARLEQGWIRWLLPDTFAAIQLRMEINGVGHVSDTFLVAPEIRVEVGFNCPDSIMLHWNNISVHAEYLLYGMENQYLEPLIWVQDTFVVLPKLNYPQNRFAVACRANPSIINRRSAAPDIATQGVGCYFRNFQAEWFGDSTIDLTLVLGTDYHLQNIVLEKRAGTAFIPIGEVAPNGTIYSFQDEHPNPGINVYRAKLTLDGGGIVYSDLAEGYFSGNLTWWLFPNPANSNGILSWICRTDEPGQFALYDMYGKLILEAISSEQLDQISLNGISPGVYFFRITEGGNEVGIGTLVIH
jgi:hypothetical protein